MEIMAEQDVTVTSTQGRVVVAGKKEILLTSGGGYIRIKDGNIDIHCPSLVSMRAKKHPWTGPDRLDVAYPQFPRNPLPENQPARFDLHLTDVPGPHGVSFPDTPWRVVRAADEAGALMAASPLLKGISDADGKVVLTDAEQQTLFAAYNDHPNEMWMVYDSHVRSLVVRPEREAWGDRDKQEHALDAMGYSDDLGRLGEGTVNESLEKLARTENKRKGASLLDKIKGQF
jgi:type VI secretion system secreted protein VgrG